MEAKFMATSNTLKESQAAFETEKAQKDQEIAQLKDEVTIVENRNLINYYT